MVKPTMNHTSHQPCFLGSNDPVSSPIWGQGIPKPCDSHKPTHLGCFVAGFTMGLPWVYHIFLF